jgi:hypothetical protein
MDDRLPTITCHPDAPLIEPGHRDSECMVCGEILTIRRNTLINDWEYVGADGFTTAYTGPPEYREDPAGFWERLAATNMGAYSALTAREKLGMLGWWHTHTPGRAVGDPVVAVVPETCGQPMWASPDGWVCRVHKELFPYETAS